MTLRKPLKLAIGTTVAVVFLWLTLRNMEPKNVNDALASSRISFMAFAFLSVIVGYSCRIERWRLMLTFENATLRWSVCAGPMLASFAANNILPFRAGDLMRALAFNGTLGTTSGVVLATVFVERLLDLLTVLGLFGVAIAALDIGSHGAVGVSGVLLIGIAAAVLSIVLFPSILAPLIGVLTRCAAQWAPRFGTRIGEEGAKSLSTLEHLARGGRMMPLVLWSVAAWVAEGCAFWFTALALPSLTRPNGGWLALPVSAFATLVPSTPGYVGTFDYFTVVAMTTVGNDPTSSTVYGFLIHIVVWLPSTVVGGTYLLLRSIRGQGSKVMAS